MSLTPPHIPRTFPTALAALFAVLALPAAVSGQSLSSETPPEPPPAESDSSKRSSTTDSDRSKSRGDSPEVSSPESNAGPANSQDEMEYFDSRHRRHIYQKGRLRYSAAALRTALLPGLGNFYAEQYLLGGLHASIMAFVAVIIPYGVLTRQVGFVWAGAGIAGVDYASAFATSALGVTRYNRRLRRRLRLADGDRGPDSAATGTPWGTSWAPTITIVDLEF